MERGRAAKEVGLKPLIHPDCDNEKANGDKNPLSEKTSFAIYLAEFPSESLFAGLFAAYC